MGKSTQKNTPKKAVKKTVSSACPKLTSKQIKFCRAIAQGENATQAAIKAGYSKHTAPQMGYENLNKPYIAEIARKNAEKAQAKFNYTQEQHFNELKSAEDFARQTGNSSAMLSAIVQKGKLCGLYVERVKAEVNGSISSFSVNQFLEKFNAEK